MDHAALLPVVVTGANALFTTLRIVAHVPQLIAVVRDPCGARAISVSSWVLFALANGSNAMYAQVIASDRLMFAINLVSTVSCAAIAIVSRIKQRRADDEDAAAAGRAHPVVARSRPYRIEATTFGPVRNPA